MNMLLSPTVTRILILDLWRQFLPNQTKCHIIVLVTVHFVFLQLVVILFERVGMGVGEGESEGGGDEL